MTRIADPQINFADIEFFTQGVDLDPILKRMSDFLDHQPRIVERVRQDLQRGLKKPDTGRTAMTPTQVLRSLILMRVKNWDYRELSERIADGYTLRRFTGFYSQRVPKHDAFNRAFNKLRPQTLQALNDLVLKAAIDLGLEDGKRLRVDTTVTETDIHHPTDNTLLWDVVRVLTRLIGRLGGLVPKGIDGFTNRTRSARRRMQEIQRMTARQRHDQQQDKYRQLIGITHQVVHNARGVLEKTKDQCAVDPMDDIIIGELRRKIDHYCQLGARVVRAAAAFLRESRLQPRRRSTRSLKPTPI
jgi:IS5 family transposase